MTTDNKHRQTTRSSLSELTEAEADRIAGRGHHRESAAQGSNRSVADHGDVLLLSVHAAIGPGRHDAAAVGRVRHVGHRHRVDGRAVLLRLLALQSGGRCGDGRPRPTKGCSARRSCRWRRLTALRHRRQHRRQHRAVHPGRRRRLRAGRRRLHRDDELSRLARGDPDRGDADVRHGRRIRWPVRRRADDRRRRSPGARSGLGWG